MSAEDARTRSSTTERLNRSCLKLQDHPFWTQYQAILDVLYHRKFISRRHSYVYDCFVTFKFLSITHVIVCDLYEFMLCFDSVGSWCLKYDMYSLSQMADGCVVEP